MKQKFSEDPTEKRTQFYNMGGWKQSERKTAFVNEGKKIAGDRLRPLCADVGIQRDDVARRSARMAREGTSKISCSSDDGSSGAVACRLSVRL